MKSDAHKVLDILRKVPVYDLGQFSVQLNINNENKIACSTLYLLFCSHKLTYIPFGSYKN